METTLAARDQWIELAKTDRPRGLLKRVAPRIVRIYTLRGFESVLAGSVQVSTGTKTSLSFQDDQYSREFIAEKARLRLDRFYRATRELGRVFKTEFILGLPEPAGASHADPTRAPQGRTATRPRPVRPLRPTGPTGSAFGPCGARASC